MALATILYVRGVGRLPEWERLPDDTIEEHLAAAARELAGMIGAYEDSSDQAKIAACKYAEACLTMHLIIPVLNTFYTQEIPGLQKEVGEVDFLFSNPADQERIANMWLERARTAVTSYMGEETNMDSGGGYVAGRVGWYAV